MMSHPRVSLPSRIYLFSIVTVFLVVGPGFWVLNKAIRAKIQVRLKESFQMSGKLLDTASARYRARSVQMLSVLNENAELKTALGLLRERQTLDRLLSETQLAVCCEEPTHS